MTAPNFLEFWYSAQSSPFGIVLESDNPQAAIQKLYGARRAAGDVDLQALSIIQSPVNPAHIWIVKRNVAQT